MKDNTDDEMKKFFGGLKDFRKERCKICGSPIPREYKKKFPRTDFCKTECTLKWLHEHWENYDWGNYG